VDKEKAVTGKNNAVIQQAERLLRCVREETGWADEVLVFFYRLRDNYTVIASTSQYLRGKSFHALNPVIYDLESRPDETANNREQRSMITGILNDLAEGKILVLPAPPPASEPSSA